MESGEGKWGRTLPPGAPTSSPGRMAGDAGGLLYMQEEF